MSIALSDGTAKRPEFLLFSQLFSGLLVMNSTGFGPLESTRRGHPRFFFANRKVNNHHNVSVSTGQDEISFTGQPFRSVCGHTAAAGVIFPAFLISKEAPFSTQKFHRLLK